jgi:hypothetical protein
MEREMEREMGRERERGERGEREREGREREVNQPGIPSVAHRASLVEASHGLQIFHEMTAGATLLDLKWSGS